MIGPDFAARRSVSPSSTIKAWVRQQLQLDDDAVVVVAELACHEPGCPPVETVISILGHGEPNLSVHLSQPLDEVTGPDVAAAFAASASRPGPRLEGH